MILALVIAVVLLIFLVSPLFLFKGELLQEAASVNSVEKLEAIKVSLLKRYIEDEKSHRERLFSDSVWRRRKQFLTTRYIDASRRQDYLKCLERLQREQG